MGQYLPTHIVLTQPPLFLTRTTHLTLLISLQTILSGVEHRLGKKVYGSFKNRVGDAIVETTSKGFQTQKETERRQKIAGNTKDDSKSRHETNRDDGSDDDEEGGRGTAFTAKKTQRQGGGLGRHDLLVQPARRKK